ncbi:hypothetical protein C7H19_14010 [Aphanothece hegewaldii CCALA 016]|uniref:Phosphodiester glycosidase domain-containing protein n=1 Tax=Aphanothece hegewaldii CCALA 016 TaxID=2107694 RepID=A0A2T1LWB3_9CHRO|nr:phosphodiester glycosidase family protein [Aphanothece hegewaldii]PSF36113.1 hypothetical protein C7H19_14010 [Aphanothece hegewaldii CCALA 016]
MRENLILISQFSLSSLVVSLLYYSFSLFPPQTSQAFSNTPSAEPIFVSDTTIIPTQQRGKEISINGKKFIVAWSQWKEGTTTHTGISDIGASTTLGIELLSTNNPNQQPVYWYLANPNQPIYLNTKFLAPYRYLDITQLIQQMGAELNIVGDTLQINYPTAQVNDLYTLQENGIQRLVLSLDRPTTWQISQVKNEATLNIEGITDPTLIAQYQPQPIITENNTNIDEDDLGSATTPKIPPQLFSLTQNGTTTQLKLNLPTAYGIQAYTISNPNRLIIDIRPDTLREKEITWQNGLTFHQRYVKLQQDYFPVTWLEIDLRSSKLTLKPLTGNKTSLTGILPLATMGRDTEAIAAINAGFFNRNNQLPLGAIRVDGKWYSSPILNRGAIAWNNQGQIKIDRLTLQENLITPNQQFTINFLNSAYLETGIARYTSEWGNNYTTLTDKETIITVENNQITAQYKANLAGLDSIPIPKNGYLLILRKDDTPATFLTQGTTVKINRSTLPREFDSYSNIIGAGPLLLQNRRIVLNPDAEKFSKPFQQQSASRSSIATLSSDRIILVAVHNRVAGKGATLKEFAQILQQLGAVNALNLDGGSSTSLYLGGNLIDRYPQTAARVHNGIGLFLKTSP